MRRKPPPWNKSEPKQLARYVWAEKTADWLSLAQPADDTFHDLRQNDPQKLVAFIYQKLASLNIAYELAEINFADHHPEQQVIRPAWVLQRSGGNCLELSLMFAAVCQSALLRPLIILLDGHALVAVWLGGDLSKAMTSGNPGPHDHQFLRQGILLPDRVQAGNKFLELVRSNEYLVVECAGFARSASHNSSTQQLTFDSACDTGRSKLDPLKLVNIVDVALLQHHKNVYGPHDVSGSDEKRQSSITLGELGIRRVREKVALTSANIELPDSWTDTALRAMLREVKHLPAADGLDITSALTSLMHALEAVELARSAIPQALSATFLRRALANLTPGSQHPPLTEDVDFFSYVALDSPAAFRDSRRNIAVYLLHLTAVAGTDSAAVLPWAYQAAGHTFVNKVLEELRARQASSRLRLIISLHTSPTGNWTQEPRAWLLDRREMATAPKILQCKPNQPENEKAVATLLLWGQAEAAKLDLPLRQVDLVPPARHVLTWQPERSVQLRLLLDDHDTVTRWSYRLNPPPHLQGGLIRSRQRQDQIKGGDHTAPIDWLEAGDVAHAEFPQRLQDQHRQAIGLTFIPRDRQALVELLLDNTPVLLWPDEGCEINPSIKTALAENWADLPRGFAAAYRAKQATKVSGTVADVRALWDDPDWLAFCLLFV